MAINEKTTERPGGKSRLVRGTTKGLLAPTKKLASEDREETYVSPLAASMHESMSDLYELGFVDEKTMRKFDASCLTPVREYDGEAIKGLRVREKFSQSVLARYLGVSLNAVGQWERGERKASGAAAKLLALIDRHGLEHIR